MTDELILSEDQLNEMAEELFERRELAVTRGFEPSSCAEVRAC